MKLEQTPQVSHDAWALGLAIAQAIRVGQNEADAIKRICMLLGFWEVKISPSELGVHAGGLFDV